MKHPTPPTKSRTLLLVCVLAVITIFAFAAASGLSPQDLSGEEFAVYHYANSYDHFTAWQRYYTEVGRPVSVAWWIYSFEIVGYNPPLLHFLSFALFLGASVLASICFYRAWPSKQRRTYLYPLLFLLFIFNWIGVELIFSVKFDQVHLALIFFFLAGLCLQAWSSSNMSRTGWLALSLGLFLVSVFAYESVVFLYPGLLLFSWPLSQKKKDNLKHFIGIGFISLFFVALPYIVYRHIGLIGSNATYRGGLSTPLDPTHLVDYISLLANFGANANSFQPISSALATIVTLYALGAGALVLIYKKRETFQHEAIHVALASLWFIFMGLAPFALAGYSTTERAYSAAVFGLGPLIALSLTAKATKLRSVTSWAAVLCICLLGIGQFFSASTQQVGPEAQQNRFFLNMKRLVPSVKSGTVFIFWTIRRATMAAALVSTCSTTGTIFAAPFSAPR